MAKKERGRFSLRFNIGDPVQRTAVELLELQPPHSKSQYIANALAYYNAMPVSAVHCAYGRPSSA